MGSAPKLAGVLLWVFKAEHPEWCSLLPAVKNEVHSIFVRRLEISAISRTNLQELQIKTPFIVLTADCMNTA